MRGRKGGGREWARWRGRESDSNDAMRGYERESATNAALTFCLHFLGITFSPSLCFNSRDTYQILR